jgi:hypothetical protein
MRIAGYRPRNNYLQRQLDRRWRQWLTWCAAGAAAMAVALGAFVGPRQAIVRLRYEIAQLKAEVAALERQRRSLQLELEAETSPHRLAAHARELNLAQVPPHRLLFLTATGELVGPPAGPSAPLVPATGVH